MPDRPACASVFGMNGFGFQFCFDRPHPGCRFPSSRVALFDVIRVTSQPLAVILVSVQLVRFHALVAPTTPPEHADVKRVLVPVRADGLKQVKLFATLAISHDRISQQMGNWLGVGEG